MSAPRATKETSLKELTLRGIIIGGIITLVFTAANVYLGLKVGLTFATSIPAAVISMAVLRFWGDHTVQENNIVQTIASAAGTAVGCHLRSPRPRDCGLVEWLPLLADHVRVRGRRFVGRHVLDSAASRARDGFGPALPRGRGRR